MRPIFPTWTEITLGNGLRTMEDFVNELSRRGYKYRDINQDSTAPLFNSPQYKSEKEERRVSFVIVEPKDLGFRGEWIDEEDFPKFFERAIKCGLELCPPETGPQILVQTNNLEYLSIAMDQILIKTSTGIDKCIFEIMNGQPTRESYHGCSRDEKPLDEGQIIHPGGPLLTVDRCHGGTTTDYPYAFIKP